MPRYPMATVDEWTARDTALQARVAERLRDEARVERTTRDALRQWAAAERDNDATELANARANRDRLLAPVQYLSDIPF